MHHFIYSTVLSRSFFLLFLYFFLVLLLFIYFLLSLFTTFFTFFLSFCFSLFLFASLSTLSFFTFFLISFNFLVNTYLSLLFLFLKICLPAYYFFPLIDFYSNFFFLSLYYSHLFITQFCPFRVSSVRNSLFTNFEFFVSILTAQDSNIVLGFLWSIEITFLLLRSKSAQLPIHSARLH